MPSVEQAAAGGYVHLLVDNELVRARLESAPNAIGVCQIKLPSGVTTMRHTHRLKPLDTAATLLLGGGDRFVTRDADAQVEKAARSPEARRPRDWTIGDLELLRLYAIALLEEQQRSFALARDRKHRAEINERQHRYAAAARLCRQWVKQARMIQAAGNVGLTEDESRDPEALLRLAREALAKLRRRFWEVTGQDDGFESHNLVGVIDAYFAHHAKPGAAPPAKKASAK